jgi:putative ABC transport system permease protein
MFFTFPAVAGNTATALDKPYSVVVTQSVARKYFGERINPLGETISISGGWAEGDYVVTAILKDVPENSNLSFGFLLSMSNLLKNDFYKDDHARWANFITYVKTEEAAHNETLDRKLNIFTRKYLGDDVKQGRSRSIWLRSIRDIHLSGIDKGWGQVPGGDLENIYLLCVIGFFIATIAWINYVNLATSQAMERVREVSVKKAIGASKSQLVGQFILESVLTNFLATVIAIGLTKFFLVQLSVIISKNIPLDIGDTNTWILVSLLFLCGSLIAGAYPALFLSSLNPLVALKGSVGKIGSGLSIRRVLVIFQFAVSLTLVAGTFAIYRQIDFMENKHLGFDTDGLLVVNGPGSLDKEKAYERLVSFKNELMKLSSVQSVASSDGIPGGGYDWSTHTYRLGATQDEIIQGENIEVIFVDPDFIKTYGIEIEEGRSWSPNSEPDMETLLVNEAAVERFGLAKKRNLFEEKLVFENNTTMGIIGVVKNTHWYSPRYSHRPIVFWPCAVCQQKFSIKINGNISHAIPEIENLFKTVFPGNPFDYYFVDDFYNKQYQVDNQIRSIITAFAVVAVFIACLGLWGLASFSITRQLKEICIRKVFGATVIDVTALLGKQFLALIIIASLIALPLIWISVTQWLSNFAFKIPISPDLFIIPLTGLIAISAMSIAFHLVRAVVSNPAKTLRSD